MLSQGVHKQTKLFQSSVGNTLDKKGSYRTPVVSRVAKRSNKGEQERGGNIRSRNNQEYRTTHAVGSYEQGMRHRIGQELGTIINKGIVT